MFETLKEALKTNERVVRRNKEIIMKGVRTVLLGTIAICSLWLVSIAKDIRRDVDRMEQYAFIMNTDIESVLEWFAKEIVDENGKLKK